MGCNTSKESVQPATEDETAKDVESNAEKAETARSVNVESTAEESRVGEASLNETRKEEEEEKEEKAAATRIQAVFRGHRARRTMKETEDARAGREAAAAAAAEDEASQERLRQEFRSDDTELSNAATKIQATFRGHASRKEQAAATAVKAAVDDAAAKIEEKMEDALDELDGIDLTDPDLNKAATKIQASFRGHKVRRDVGPTGSPEVNE